jgi:hypothetical protein
MDITHAAGDSVRVYSEDTRGMIEATVTGHLGELVGVQTPDVPDQVAYLPAPLVHVASV